jgi:hypothetical protein
MIMGGLLSYRFLTIRRYPRAKSPSQVPEL